MTNFNQGNRRAYGGVALAGASTSLRRKNAPFSAREQPVLVNVGRFRSPHPGAVSSVLRRRSAA